MGTKRKAVNLTKQEIQDYCKQSSHVNMATLAAKYGVSRETIASRLRELKDPEVDAAIKRNKEKSNVKMTDAMLSLIIADYENDMEMEDIVDKYHMTAPTINKYLRLSGIATRNRKPKVVAPTLVKHRSASKVRIPKTHFTIPHRMMTISMRQHQCSA